MQLAWLKTFVDAFETARGHAGSADDGSDAGAHRQTLYPRRGLGMPFLPTSMVRRELIEGRLMDAHFDLFPLPEVLTYYLVKDMGILEREFLERIQAVHFS